MRKSVVRFLTMLLFVNMVLLFTSVAGYAADGVRIDGYFDDWEDKPETDIYYNSMERYRNKGSVVIENGYLYVRIKMGKGYNYSMAIGNYTISVGQKSVTANIQFCDANGNIDYSQIYRLYNLPKGTTTGLNVIIGYYPMYNVGDAAILVRKNNSKNDEIEFSIRISDLEEIMKLPANSIENGSRIEISQPQLGSQKMILVGTSTGAVIGLAVCAGTVLLTLALRKRKNRETA